MARLYGRQSATARNAKEIADLESRLKTIEDKLERPPKKDF
jgi:hypothetical protein